MRISIHSIMSYWYNFGLQKVGFEVGVWGWGLGVGKLGLGGCEVGGLIGKILYLKIKSSKSSLCEQCIIYENKFNHLI